MKKQLLYSLIKDPEELTESTLDGIQSLVDEFPYFQAARILLLKNLHILDDVRFEPELKNSAIYVPDRNRLFGIISGWYKADVVETVEHKEKETEDTVSEKSTSESSSSVAVTGNVESVTDYFGVDEVTETMSGGTVEFSLQEKEEKKEEESIPDDQLFEYEKQGNNGYYLDTLEYFPDTGKSKSFSEWLNLIGQAQAPSVSDDKKRDKPEKKKNRTIDIIDNFLNSQNEGKKITPPKKTADSAVIKEKDTFDGDELMTETLAGIYIKQGHYSRAIGIFKKLSLKYPEKSVYFAQQIEKLENLISNQ